MIIGTSSLSKQEQLLEKPVNYGEIVARLETAQSSEYGPKAVERMMRLDAALGFISQKIDIILVGGSNGKSLSVHFAAKLLREEGVSVGACYSSHVLSYNERICSEQHAVSNKAFAEAVSVVLTACDREKIQATTFEITTMAALVHFVEEKIGVALVEVSTGGRYDATAAFHAKIVAITRIAADHAEILGSDLDVVAQDMVALARPGAWVISAEQSKLRLQKMKDFALASNINWAMPLRKLSQLPYVYEQLFGRTASLGERIAHMYLEKVKETSSAFLKVHAVTAKQGQRGRPTLEAKKQALLHPVKTLKAFWAEKFDLLRGRFELLDKEKPTILLDNADNIDALSNLFLGVRLLHYQRPLKGLALVMGLGMSVDVDETLRMVRYLLRKINGQVFFIELPGSDASHNPHMLVKAAEELGIASRAFSTLKEAFEEAKTAVDERHGLVAVTGSTKVVASYWRTVRDIKRF